ncbi:MAG: hypothetical protein KatS3mg110_0884 [Pirellulaceae bacterium]|nr:MAG: hypothetical protein KatS3mg110_0884 [Pirellulaceae bacterium]
MYAFADSRLRVALAGKNAQFHFGHVEPTAMFPSGHNFPLLQQPRSFLRGQNGSYNELMS